MRKNVTRRGRLENKLRVELAMSKPEVGKLLDAIDEFEADNIATIEKLKKKKQIEAKKINGAIRQTINAHGPVTMLLIGSCTKRILGSLMTNEIEKDEPKYSIKSIGVGLIIGMILTTLMNFFL